MKLKLRPNLEEKIKASTKFLFKKQIIWKHESTMFGGFVLKLKIEMLKNMMVLKNGRRV